MVLIKNILQSYFYLIRSGVLESIFEDIHNDRVDFDHSNDVTKFFF